MERNRRKPIGCCGFRAGGNVVGVAAADVVRRAQATAALRARAGLLQLSAVREEIASNGKCTGMQASIRRELLKLLDSAPAARRAGASADIGDSRDATWPSRGRCWGQSLALRARGDRERESRGRPSGLPQVFHTWVVHLLGAIGTPGEPAGWCGGAGRPPHSHQSRRIRKGISWR